MNNFVRMHIFLFFFTCCIPLYAHRIDIHIHFNGTCIVGEIPLQERYNIENTLVNILDGDNNNITYGYINNNGKFNILLPYHIKPPIEISTNIIAHKIKHLVSYEQISYVLFKLSLKQQKHTYEQNYSNNFMDQKILFIENQLSYLVDEFNRIRLNDILGGVGYIFGIIGFVSLFYKRVKY